MWSLASRHVSSRWLSSASSWLAIAMTMNRLTLTTRRNDDIPLYANLPDAALRRRGTRRGMDCACDAGRRGAATRGVTARDTQGSRASTPHAEADVEAGGCGEAQALSAQRRRL